MKLKRVSSGAFCFPKSKGLMNNPVFPTIQTAYIFQKFANIDWKMYGKTEGKHMGIDLGLTSGLPGSPIYAVQVGRVIEAGYFDQGGYGRRVVIEHEDKSYCTLYAHLKEVHVKNGDVVTAGQQIGTMGGNVEDPMRGASKGTHLHFEVILPQPVKNSIRTFKGWCVDPIPYLMQRYFFAPINAIHVTSVKGLRVRTEPDVISPSINSLSLHDVVNVMQVLKSDGVNQWVKLWTLRDEYCAIKYGGMINAELIHQTVDNTPQPDLISDSQPVSPATFEQGYAKALTEIQTFIEGKQHAA